LAPDPWSVSGFVDAVATELGRPIRLLAYPLTSSDPTGLWVSTRSGEYIVVPEQASGTRRDAIVAHEIAHIVLGDEPLAAVADGGACAHLLEAASPELVARFMPRHGFDSDAERRAEWLATVLLSAVGQRAMIGTSRSETARLASILR
jgi:Zn-dependent peptidase ImmA (M78 family)